MVNFSLFIILLRVTSDLFSEALPLSLEASVVTKRRINVHCHFFYHKGTRSTHKVTLGFISVYYLLLTANCSCLLPLPL